MVEELNALCEKIRNHFNGCGNCPYVNGNCEFDVFTNKELKKASSRMKKAIKTIKK